MPRKRKPKLVPGRDYIFDTDGRCVFTREYLLGLGACCDNGCRNCPYPQNASAAESADLPQASDAAPAEATDETH
jgi:hypothetical protein